LTNISIIIPAYNEEQYIGPTLEAIQRSVSRLPLNVESEIIVVDHSSSDGTAENSARANKILRLARGGTIGTVRNYGAAHAGGEYFVFIDADTIVPETLLPTLVNYFRAGITGGAIRGLYRPAKLSMRLFCQFWGWYAAHSKKPMTQGICQFSQRELFHAIGGYDETLWYAEDADFYWRLNEYATRYGMLLVIPSDIFVLPSTRRLDKWPAWKVILLTNPLVTRFRLRSRQFWRAWYDDNSTRR